MYLKQNTRKVRDYDHLTGDYSGASHSYGNINYLIPRFVSFFSINY
jgi:hypothetical protein